MLSLQAWPWCCWHTLRALKPQPPLLPLWSQQSPLATPKQQLALHHLLLLMASLFESMLFPATKWETQLQELSKVRKLQICTKLTPLIIRFQYQRTIKLQLWLLLLYPCPSIYIFVVNLPFLGLFPSISVQWLLMSKASMAIVLAYKVCRTASSTFVLWLLVQWPVVWSPVLWTVHRPTQLLPSPPPLLAVSKKTK